MFTLNLWGNDEKLDYTLEDSYGSPTNYQFGKENDLNQTNFHDYVPNFQGCSICFKSQTIHVCYIYLNLPEICATCR